ncbi:DUF1707 SHOCT-like domain-containing protein [Pseudonocardia spinosispora]|uniref:DUF1707 SHOCT-like domain-containing protein n=1 Tax=Pseudonocardia spinosispora TaxID=103441 RepID=UPI00049031CC|nr:DUF1707 domain-containing protein [Pseudonocardia spinosispora]
MDDPVSIVTSIRASDAEREETASVIRAAASEGRLTMAELEERLESVYEARMRHELPPLVADLPSAQRPPDGPPGNGPGVGARIGLAVHALLVVAFAAAMIGRWVMTGMPFFFWPVFPIFWALVTLAVHARIRGVFPSG